jgi:ribosomal protein L21E
VPLTTYLRNYKVGDYVDIKVNAAIHKVRCRDCGRRGGEWGATEGRAVASGEREWGTMAVAAAPCRVTAASPSDADSPTCVSVSGEARSWAWWPRRLLEQGGGERGTLCAFLRSPLPGDRLAQGMPYKWYHGKTGIVWNVTKRAIGVEVQKAVSEAAWPSRCLIWSMRMGQEWRVEAERDSGWKEGLPRGMRSLHALCGPCAACTLDAHAWMHSHTLTHARMDAYTHTSSLPSRAARHPLHAQAPARAR